MGWLARIVAGLLSDALSLVVLLLRPSTAIRAEKLVVGFSPLRAVSFSHCRQRDSRA